MVQNIHFLCLWKDWAFIENKLKHFTAVHKIVQLCVHVSFSVSFSNSKSNWKARALSQETNGWRVRCAVELLNCCSSRAILKSLEKVFEPLVNDRRVLSIFVWVSWWWGESYRCVVRVACSMSHFHCLGSCKFEELQLYLYIRRLVKCGTQYCDNPVSYRKKAHPPRLPHFSIVYMRACLWIACCFFFFVVYLVI